LGEEPEEEEEENIVKMLPVTVYCTKGIAF